MFRQTKLLLVNERRFKGGFSLLAVSFALLVLLAGCDDEIDGLTPDSNATLRMEESKFKSKTGYAKPLTSGLQGASGSTVGPDGALYVTEYAFGRISRINPKTGEIMTFASGFPLPIFDIGGVWDVAFLGRKAYALVTLVGPELGGNPGDVVGIYRIDGPNSFTVIADIGAFSLANPPNTDFFVPTGVQYSFQSYRGAFLVADGHHNRILHVTCNGEITEFKTFGNVVPTGLALWGNRVYMAEAGPIPHNPEDGKVVSFGPISPIVRDVASGARLLVDVEFNYSLSHYGRSHRGRAQWGLTLYALSQGEWDGVQEGSPAIPNDGSLLRVNKDGTFTVISDGLDRPTSLEFIRNKAYIVTLAGEVWTISNFGHPHFGL